MPTIRVITPALSSEKRNELAKELYDAAYPIIRNREIYTLIDEPGFYVNGAEQKDGYIHISVDGPKLSEEDLKKLYKDLYDASTKVLGERRTMLNYGTSDLNTLGINGLIFADYKASKAAKK